ncbi:NAD(P)H-binding protein [Actinocatenispora rupis]|uniref:NAD(P)-dependent oxidoreductase n=1 Tax=Actinocatenispora rupis TaxID=519421 RepID=A0A8J3JED7_9ACTN|nr:NAD(P)H-binding protein [Actinocatenispora rupis]GID14937.1 NAD(P)-dependent oxidoreductase [Actinocatenispora rupis]
MTGVTGQLGGRVARRLAAAGITQTMIARHPRRAPRLPRARVMPGNYGDRTAMRRALTGVERVLLVSATATPDRVAQQGEFLRAAQDAGVGLVVYVSFCTPWPEATFVHGRDHWWTEQHLAGSGIPHIILRNNFYAEFVGRDLTDGRAAIRGPAEDGRVAAVALDDIAEAATNILTGVSGQAGATYTLTGPAAVGLDEVADAASTACGRRVSYRPETLRQAYRARDGAGPARQVEAWVSTYRAIAAGEMAAVTDHVARLTGRPATPLAEAVSCLAA